MWSTTFIDYSLHKNFNFGFASHKNDVHIQLSQWQYWWWFWFAAVWALYFLVILRCYSQKIDNYNISINTSMRSHGKWGDFLVALIPLSWCGNILINSNFILRMLEWQNESSLFTIRIQAKQWYWVYKYSGDTNFRLNNVFINVGNNNWLKATNQSNLLFNHNTSFSHFLFDCEFKASHIKEAGKYQRRPRHFRIYSYLTHSGVYNTPFPVDNTSYSNVLSNYKLFKFSKLKFNHNSQHMNMVNFNNTNNVLDSDYTQEFLYKTWITKQKLSNYISAKYRFADEIIIPLKDLHPIDTRFNILEINKSSPLQFETDAMDEFDETTNNFRTKTAKFPIKLHRGLLNKHNLQILRTEKLLTKNIFFNFKINETDFTEKISQPEQFWGFKQKKYKRLKAYSFPKYPRYDSINYTYIGNFLNKSPVVYGNMYTAIKNNKYKNELIPVTLARRLLRTKRTLILPAHINLTLITNSYDVIHSWFVPGLGLKIDCVPGRSTHHSLYIDNIGFYYGQCAEICGRYHHHMPIRVCALPFEHFMIWWQTKGLPRMYRSKKFIEKKSILLNKFTYI